MDAKEELYQLYTALEAHGIYIDQVDMDEKGELYRWIVEYGGGKRESIERWHNPGDALRAALVYMLWEK